MIVLMKFVNVNQNLNSMEENLSFRALLESESSTEESKLRSLEAGVIVWQKSFIDVSKEVGVFRALKSFYVRYLYILRLWVIREERILQILCENYKEIPNWTISKAVVWLLCTFPVLSRLCACLATVSRRRLMTNPYRGLTINSKQIDKRLVETFKESHGIN